ncbi:MAG: hypothetical protein QNI90_14800 [Dinoroseobacter sp.]|nr:hypothetical protein [Dinoroseobacter sp.]
MSDPKLPKSLRVFGRNPHEIDMLMMEDPNAFLKAINEALAQPSPRLEPRETIFQQITTDMTGLPSESIELVSPKMMTLDPRISGYGAGGVGMWGIPDPGKVFSRFHLDKVYFVEGHVPVFDLAMDPGLESKIESQITYEAEGSVSGSFILNFSGFGGGGSASKTLSAAIDFKANGAYQLACTAIFEVERWIHATTREVAHVVTLYEARSPVFQCRQGDPEFTPLDAIQDWAPRKIGSTINPFTQVLILEQSGGLEATATLGSLGDEEDAKGLSLSCSVELKTALKLSLTSTSKGLLYLDVSDGNPLALKLRPLAAASA